MKDVRVLVVEDEKLIRWSLVQALSALGCRALGAESGERARQLIEEEEPDIVLLDFKLPGMNGLDLLEWIKGHHARIEVAMMTGHGNLELAVKAMKMGAADYLQKPFQPEEIRLLVTRLVERMKLAGRLRRQLERRQRLCGVDRLVGSSKAMVGLRRLIMQLDQSRQITVLLEGESGTGKSFVARVLHQSGGRANRPFMEISCTSLSPTLIESELFGHERGAFTDAKSRKRGIVELADGGTVFLDEIGDMPAGGQAKLLQLLEQRRFRRVGGTEELEVDVGIIAATNKNLEMEVEKGTFRKDLFFRLSAIRIEIPPLRDHIEDIPELCAHFVEMYNREMNRHVKGVSPAALDMMMNYHWPGNVRELRNNIERAFVLGCTEMILPEHLALFTPAKKDKRPAQVSLPEGPMTLEQLERHAIEQALAECGGNQCAAARRLGISRDTLRYRMKKHGLLENYSRQAKVRAANRSR
ncbi:MAG: sigma-54-dependent Fis family transcriptional regulator [Deltaproteobacteria bacterium]|nr:MAG: sigma-54-dependent Fis family transcriptional regulator [Deltaproteobacteria bacterium]